ncbi:hypothetical protein GOODEAATRI_033684 [Goodea atripinnis]|uniref:Uncharacterized protein n=1 Tax=Goodea atripinnis TaxID=208336 RepID=A0ABV0Q378_9TELE
MLLQKLYEPFNIIGAFTDVKVTHAMGSNTPPYHHRCWLLNFVLITIWIVKVFGNPDIDKFKCGLVRPQHTLPICVSPSQLSSGPEKSAAFLGVVWLCMVEF